MNPKRVTDNTQSITFHCSSWPRGDLGVLPVEHKGKELGPWIPNLSEEHFQIGTERLWQLLHEQAATSQFPIQSEECPCSLLSLSVLSQPSQISPDKAHYRDKEATRVTKKCWLQPRKRIKVNWLTVDNMSLPESKCSPRSEEFHSRLYHSPRMGHSPWFWGHKMGFCKQRTTELSIKTWGEMQRFWCFFKP